MLYSRFFRAAEFFKLDIQYIQVEGHRRSDWVGDSERVRGVRDLGGKEIREVVEEKGGSEEGYRVMPRSS